MNRTSRFLIALTVGGCSALAALPTRAAILVSDNFESYTTTDVIWPTPGDPDADPVTTPQGQSWTIVEFNAPRANIVSHPQNLPASPGTSPSFAAASGTKYLHLFKTASGNGQAWLDLTSADQAAIAAQGAVHVSANVFALSGHDLWNGNISITAFDSAATAGTNLAFDVNVRDGGYGVNGFVNTSNNRTSGTPTTIPDQINVWQSLTIDVDFVADTYTIALGANAPQTFAMPNNLSKISSLMFSAGDIGLTGNWRGGIDDLLVVVPEPTSAGLLLTMIGGLLGTRRRHRIGRGN